MISIFSNTLGSEETAAVNRVFRSSWLGKGPECSKFELEFGAHVGQNDVLLFNCCTSATFVALEALGIGHGDEVIVPTVNFVGVANAVVRCGAVPVFADVDQFTLNLDPMEIERLRTKRTKAVFLLHYGGRPADMSEILRAADGLYVLEDAANAPASKWQGRACGTIGDAGVWSFDAMKILVMGDGGALWMRSEDATLKAKTLRYLGLAPKSTSGMDSAATGNGRWWEYQVVKPSGRYVSNDVLAAVGRVQLRKLAEFVKRRREIWDMYQDGFHGLTWLWKPPELEAGDESSYYLYWIQTAHRDELAAWLYDRGVYTTFRYHPLHLVDAYGSPERLPVAEKIAERTLCLPLHQRLTDDDVRKVIDRVCEFGRILYG